MGDSKKLDLSDFLPEGWEGRYPPCQIRMDADGELWGEGRRMVHAGIIELIYESVHYEDEIYFLEVDGKRCQLEVDDTFYVVTAVSEADGGLRIDLNDGSSEALDPAAVWVGQNDVMYCQVKGGAMAARFKRQAYYQLAEWIEEEGDSFVLNVGGVTHPVNQRQ